MKTYMIIGVGGTGSYVVNNLLNYLGALPKQKARVILIDGDILEKRNLLRQGFLPIDIEKNKAQALVERFNKVIPKHITLEYKDTFINTMADLLNICGKDSDSYTFISCVDNNMARYRILMTQYKLFYDTGKTVAYIDGGNTEWQGQAVVNLLIEGNQPPLQFSNNGVIFTGNTEGHLLSTIFDQWDDWETRLTRGDHELSCEIVTEASPQNIATNMTSASGIMFQLHQIESKTKRGLRYQFNASKGTQEVIDIQPNVDRLEEFALYANSAGYEELFETRQIKDDLEFQQLLDDAMEDLEDSMEFGHGERDMEHGE